MDVTRIAIALFLLLTIGGAIYYFVVYVPAQKKTTATRTTNRKVVVRPRNEVSVTKVVKLDSDDVLFGKSLDGTYVERDGKQMLCKRYPVEVIRV